MREITELEIAAAVKTLSATPRGRALLGILAEMVDEPHVPAATHEPRCAIALLAAQCRGQGNTVRDAIAGGIEQGHGGHGEGREATEQKTVWVSREILMSDGRDTFSING